MDDNRRGTANHADPSEHGQNAGIYLQRLSLTEISQSQLRCESVWEKPRQLKAWMQNTGVFDCPTEERLTDRLALIDKSYYTNGERKNTLRVALNSEK
jgi:hypothetical protein